MFCLRRGEAQAENHHGQLFELGTTAQPFQDIQSRPAGHELVQEDDVRAGELIVDRARAAFQQGNGFFTRRNHPQVPEQGQALHGTPDQKDIIVVIVSPKGDKRTRKHDGSGGHDLFLWSLKAGDQVCAFVSKYSGAASCANRAKADCQPGKTASRQPPWSTCQAGHWSSLCQPSPSSYGSRHAHRGTGN